MLEFDLVVHVQDLAVAEWSILHIYPSVRYFLEAMIEVK